jgi:hypothetical protein
MDDPSDRLINIFGALSQAVSDRVRLAIAEAFNAGGETAAALIARYGKLSGFRMQVQFASSRG